MRTSRRKAARRGRLLALAIALGNAIVVGQPAAKPDLLARPASLPAELPKLSPLLAGDSGKIVSSIADWSRRRAELRKAWQQVLGELPQEKAPLQAEFLQKTELADFTRQYVKYQVEDGVLTDGWLLLPKSATGRLPALVVFHPTIATHTAQVAGLDTSQPERMHGVNFVKRGYAVLCPRCFIFADGADYLAHVGQMRSRHASWTGMARMTWDAIRAADFLLSLPYVDSRRLGCFGHSLGAKEALYAAAFDERYRVAVFSEGGIGLSFSNWDAPWYLGSQSKQPDFLRDHHELIGLIAPRGFLLLAGESADGDRSWAYLEAALPVYRLLNATARLGWLNHRQGHAYPASARSVAEAFIDRQLAE